MSKNYYLSKSKYCFSQQYISEIKTEKVKAAMLSETFESTLLVQASNPENARIAVIKSIEKDGQFVVIKCRIDDPIIGD